MTSLQFKTVEEDKNKLHWVENDAMMILDRQGKLSFNGVAHWNLDVTRPTVTIDQQYVQHVQADNEYRTTGGFVKFEKDCVRVSCWPEKNGPYQHHSKRRFFWFDVDVETWQRLWKFFIQPHNKVTIADRRDDLKLSNPYVIVEI